MELIPIGINGPYPVADSACSGYIVINNNTKILIDIGSGVISKLLSMMDLSDLDAIIISHWHADHCSDIEVLSYYYQMNNLKSRITVYGIDDEKSNYLDIVKKNKYFLYKSVKDKSKIIINEMQIDFGQANHPVKALMMKITELEHGKSMVYTGDTNWFDNLPNFVSNCDCLLADSFFLHENWDNSKPHLSVELSCKLAIDGHIKKLLLTHISPLIPQSIINIRLRKYNIDVEIAKIKNIYTI